MDHPLDKLSHEIRQHERDIDPLVKPYPDMLVTAPNEGATDNVFGAELDGDRQTLGKAGVDATLIPLGDRFRTRQNPANCSVSMRNRPKMLKIRSSRR